jgi:DNA polymerase III alpha subunit
MSIGDFLDYFPMASKGLLTNLTLSGAFDDFGQDRGHLLAQIEPLLKRSLKANPAPFDPDQIDPVAFTFEDRFRGEQATLGFCISPPPVLAYSPDCTRIGDLSQRDVGCDVTVGGLVTQVRSIVTQTGQEMAFIDLRDKWGEISVTLRSRVLGDADSVNLNGQIIMARGRVQRARNGSDKLELLADRFWKWNDDGSGGVSHMNGRGLQPMTGREPAMAKDAGIAVPPMTVTPVATEVDGASDPFKAEARQRGAGFGIA